MFGKKKHSKLQVLSGSLASRIREVWEMDDFDKPSVGGQPHISSALPQAFRYSVRQIDREERTRRNKGGGRTVFRVGVCIYGYLDIYIGATTDKCRCICKIWQSTCTNLYQSNQLCILGDKQSKI